MRTKEDFQPLDINSLHIEDIRKLIESDKLITIDINDALIFCKMCIDNGIYILGCDALEKKNYDDLEEYILDLSDLYLSYCDNRDYQQYSNKVLDTIRCYIDNINKNNIQCILEFTLSHS